MTTNIGASSSSSPVSFSSHSWTYDVFFSFRGDDTRHTFTAHLNSCLVGKGLRTFIDADELLRGQSIPDSLKRAIEESKICVIVFSVNYAYSGWCLEELVKILNCKSHQIVYPIFYKVEPSDVRNMKGSFGKALDKHECTFAGKDEMERLGTWRMALKKAGNLSGRHLSYDGYEPEFLDKVVEEISRLVLKCVPLDVANYPTGIESRVKDVLKLLNVGQNNIQIVGIWGFGGIGKTTVAKAVYNSISHEFDSCCFLADVSKEASIQGGLVKLQNTLLSKILGDRGPFDLKDADEGINVIKTRLRRKKILLILDDVNHSDQLDKLIGVRSDWFDLGSRIIITTRDKKCLVLPEVNHIYEVKELSNEEALQLFNFNAFKRTTPTNNFVKLADDVVRYAKGLPLVLEVLGSDLCGKNSLDEWRDALDNYKTYPNPNIQETLRRSYDTLGESVKEVFLYIACFFKGQTKSCVIDVLESCGLNPKHGIGVLREKALIKIVEDDRVWMHDLIEVMGKEVVRQESPDPGKRSRLWLYDDIRHVLEDNQGTDKIKGILVTDDIPKDICLNSGSFRKLKNLQIFLAYTKKFSGNEMDYLSSQLRVLYWNNCPLQSFPTDFNPRKIVMLHMNQARLFPLSKERLKNMQYVKSIHLPGCEGVTRVPDLSGLRSLVDLNLSKCEHLVEVDDSVGVLDKLVRLDLSNCIKLTMFQARINLTSLEYLNLQCCPLKSFPEIKGEMKRLNHLNLSKSGIRKFPSSVTNLPQHTSGEEDRALHVDLSMCVRLQKVSEFPEEIDYLNLRDSSSLTRVSKLSRISEGKELKMMRWMDLSGCQTLCDNILTNSKTMPPLLKSSATSAPCQDKEKLNAVLSLFLSCRKSEFEVVFPSSAPVPKWFTSRMKFNGTKLAAHPYKYCICIQIPEDFSWENKGLAICAQSSEDCRSFFDLFSVHINEICVIRPYGNRENYPYAQTMHANHMWLYYIPFLTLIKRLKESGLPPPQKCIVRFEVEVDHPLFDSMYASDAFQMKSCGVHVVMPTE